MFDSPGSVVQGVGNMVNSNSDGSPLFISHPSGGSMGAGRPEKSVRELVEERLDTYDQYKVLIHHPASGMAAKGFTQVEIEAAEKQVDDMILFYEDMLEKL